MTVLSPMMAVLAEAPFDDPDWTFEPKWDGVRALIDVHPDGVTISSRNANDFTVAYPELVQPALTLPPDTVVDGEIIAFLDGNPSFERLQSRMHLRDSRRIERARLVNPVVFMAFDLLVAEGRDVMGVDLVGRRALLEDLLEISDHVQISPQLVGEGIALFEAAQQQGLEGIVAKRMDSTYLPGRRSPNWRKIKVVHEVDAVVMGWRPGGGGRRGAIGSLVLGLLDGTTWRYVGSVGSGFSARSLVAMREILDMLASPDPSLDIGDVPDGAAVRWVTPSTVAVVEYRQVTRAGHLRAPVFKGMRSDKAPTECTLDQLSFS